MITFGEDLQVQCSDSLSLFDSISMVGLIREADLNLLMIAVSSKIEWFYILLRKHRKRYLKDLQLVISLLKSKLSFFATDPCGRASH